MRKRVPVICSIAAAALAVFVTFAVSLIAQTPESPTPQQEQSLKKFLRTYVGEPNPAFEHEWATQYSAALVDLKGDGTREVIVYLSGRGWCGSGGCVMLVLAPEGESYKVVTKTTVTRLPIRVLETKSNGWRDVSVVVAGGGIRPAYEAELCFDGKTYPSNPSVHPARRLEGEAAGEVVISATSKDEPLYP